MTFTFVKTEIEQCNLKLKDGIMSKVEYDEWKEALLTKMDLFALKKRLTSLQYETLFDMFV